MKRNRMGKLLLPLLTLTILLSVLVLPAAAEGPELALEAPQMSRWTALVDKAETCAETCKEKTKTYLSEKKAKVTGKLSRIASEERLDEENGIAAPAAPAAQLKAALAAARAQQAQSAAPAAQLQAALAARTQPTVPTIRLDDTPVAAQPQPVAPVKAEPSVTVSDVMDSGKALAQKTAALTAGAAITAADKLNAGAELLESKGMERTGKAVAVTAVVVETTVDAVQHPVVTAVKVKDCAVELAEVGVAKTYAAAEVGIAKTTAAVNVAVDTAVMIAQDPTIVADAAKACVWRVECYAGYKMMVARASLNEAVETYGRQNLMVAAAAVAAAGVTTVLIVSNS